MLDYDDFLQADRPQVFGIHKVLPTPKLPPPSPSFLQGSLKNFQYWQGEGVQGRGDWGFFESNLQLLAKWNITEDKKM